MSRLYEAAALAFGMLTLVLLTAIAMWMGNHAAVRMMIGCILAAYFCQVCGGVFERNGVRWVQAASFVFWLASVVLGALAVWLMVR